MARQRILPHERDIRAALELIPHYAAGACTVPRDRWGYWVYHLMSAGQYLYVGITYVLEERLRCHRREKPWWPQVSLVVADRHCCKRHALIEEGISIRDGHPVHNLQRVGPWRRQSLPSERLNTLLGYVTLRVEAA